MECCRERKIVMSMMVKKNNIMAVIQYLYLYLFIICHDATIYRENQLLYRAIVIVMSIIGLALFMPKKRISKQYI